MSLISCSFLAMLPMMWIPTRRSKVRMVEMVGIHKVMWIVMLESAKDRILEVDTPGQHVPPRVQYGMAC
jgi:hypothetical protein